MKAQEIIDNARVRIDDDGQPIIVLATCGHCGRTWNDAAISSLTPTPAGRCPFEYDHEESASLPVAVRETTPARWSRHIGES